MLRMDSDVVRDTPNKFHGRRRTDPTPSKVRSAITNGSKILTDCDHRGAWPRRLKDLIAGYLTDLGGEGEVTESERALVRRAAMLTLQLELLEQRFSENEGGEADAQRLELYQRTTNTLRRTLASFGLKRRSGGTDEDETIARQFFEEYRKPNEAAR